MDKWIIIHPTHLRPNPFMTQPAHLPPLESMNPVHLCASLVCSLKEFTFVYPRYLQYVMGAIHLSKET